MAARYFSATLSLALFLVLVVLPPNATAIVEDTQAPVASISSPAVSTSISKTETFRVDWTGVDTSPSSGIAFYDVQVKVGAGNWSNWVVRKAGTTADYIGNQGAVYYFQVRATDSSENVGKWSEPSVTRVPYDQDRHLRGRSGFSNTVSISTNEYYLGTFRQSAQRGDYVIYKFKAAHFALISTKGKKQGKARIFVDGKLKRSVDTYSRTPKYRQIVFEIDLKRRWHAVKIVNLGTPGRPRFDVDGHVL